jgi:hypothetical protein
VVDFWVTGVKSRFVALTPRRDLTSELRHGLFDVLIHSSDRTAELARQPETNE